ncbi:MAG: protein-glutamate O-methyltransferase CheR [Planctomycetota bacterium]
MAIKSTKDPLGQLVDEAYSRWGIVVDPRKKQMVESRLDAAARRLAVPGLRELVEALRSDSTGKVEAVLFDALSTNFTSFFREKEQIDYVVGEARREGLSRVRYWSAGCSNGSEPYSLAIALSEALRDRGRTDVKILASDLAISELRTAKAAQYQKEAIARMPLELQKRHFEPISPSHVRVKEATRSAVTVASINLAGPWRLRGPFDAIFCRNVMIYFDEESRVKLVERFAKLLRAGGFLVIGLTESITGRCEHLQMQRPGVYQKTGAIE